MLNRHLRPTIVWPLVAGTLLLPTRASSSPISFLLRIANPTATVVRLTNTSPGSAEINGLILTIGDTAYNYDLVHSAQAEVDTGATLTPTLVEGDTANGGPRTDLLRYTFTGFEGSDRFRFGIDIDIDDANTTEDFRTVLFNNGAAENATVVVTFADGPQTGILTLTLPDGTPGEAGYNFTAEGTTVPEPLSLTLVGSTLLLGAILRRHAARI